MAAWIFQAKPERYEIKKLKENDSVTWLVTRYRREMSKGDIVFFWRAGDRKERGIYGWGCTTGDEPIETEGWGYGIGIVYKAKFENPICVDDLEGAGMLSENLILRMPIGTNFKVTDDELVQLSQMIEQRGEKPPNCAKGDEL